MRALRNPVSMAGLSGVRVVGIAATAFVLAVVCTGLPDAANARTSPRFAMTASAELSPAAASQTADAIELAAILDRSASEGVPADTQSRAFALTAKLAHAPDACSDDTIFENGFEG